MHRVLEANAKLGLRERKKLQTENAISVAAVELALEKGHANVTVAEIVERADVSRSTFFNYMPSREAAIFGKSVSVPEAAWIHQRLTHHTASRSLTQSIALIVSEIFQLFQLNTRATQLRHQLVQQQPDSVRMLRDPLDTMFDDIFPAVESWLVKHPEAQVTSFSATRETAMLIGLTSAAVQDLLIDFQGSEFSSEDVDAARARWDDSIELMKQIVQTV